MSEDVVEFTLIVGDAAGHVLLHRLRRQDFDTNVDDSTSVESQVLDEEIVSHKGVLAKLHFDGDTVLDMVRLVVGENHFRTLIQEILPLFVERHLSHSFQLVEVVGDII